jgi:hypothetical protein
VGLSAHAQADALLAGKSIFSAGGEFLAIHFQNQERVRGTPVGGYTRRPPIGLRLSVDDRRLLACKPGWTPVKRGYANRVPVVREPARLHLDRVQVELVTPGLNLTLILTEDGAELGRCALYPDHAKNAENIKLVARTLQKLLADPMSAVAAQSDNCCCCGKPLTDITSRLRGIGPDCVRYFAGAEGIAKAVREKYRSLDAEWWCD